MTRGLRAWPALIPPAVLIVAWAVAARAGWPNPRAIASPGAVLALAGTQATADGLWRDLLATVARAATGVAIATALGAATGVLLGRSQRAWRAVEPTVDFVRAVPPVLVFPLLLLALGYGNQARIAAVVFGTTGTVVIHVAFATARIPAARLNVARLAGLRGWRALRVLYVWEVMPGLITGVRIALAQALVIAAATEMLLGARHGLGSRALEAQLTYRADLLWLVIVAAGLAGLAMSSVLVALERWLRWRRGE